MRRVLSWFSVLFVWIACAAAGQAALREVVATDVRITMNGGKTRIVLNLSDSAQVETFLLADPSRLVLNLPETVWKLPKNWAQTRGGVVAAFRFGKLGPGRSRMVFDLSAPAKVASVVTFPPQGERRYRLVIDLEPIDLAGFRKMAGWPESEASQLPGQDLAPDPKRPQRAKKLICIDPGHGGIDPGATGVTGTLEKDLVLTASLQLRDVLLRSGRYDVAMTRDSDIFLSLKARVAFCRSKAADLMISVHADSATVAVRGATVYTLSEKASDTEAEQLARAENQSDVIAGVEIGREDDVVSSILIDLAQRDTKMKSVNFAHALVPELQKTGRTVPRSHKFAGFRVLKAPDVPSVLLEMGYLTNAADEIQLQSAAWRAMLAQAVLRALDAHFGGVSRSPSAP
jgi:N-acetylmuramoyl-L-alanine amidase